jgi:hypothetical protein
VKVKEKMQSAEVPFDPVLFAATVPSRKPTAKDIADTKEHKDDLIEPQDYESMDDMVEDL